METKTKYAYLREKIITKVEIKITIEKIEDYRIIF